MAKKKKDTTEELKLNNTRLLKVTAVDWRCFFLVTRLSGMRRKVVYLRSEAPLLLDASLALHDMVGVIRSCTCSLKQVYLPHWNPLILCGHLVKQITGCS